jgi:hypothetical protein
MSRRDATNEPRNEYREDWHPDWGPLEDTPANGIVPAPGQEKVLFTRIGAVNNGDLYISVPATWLNGANTSVPGTPVIPTFNLYRIIHGAQHLLRSFQLTGNAAIDASNGVQLQPFRGGAQLHVQILIARGFICDGFLVTVSVEAAVLVDPDGFGKPSNGFGYTWGRETALAAGDSASKAIGPASNVTVVGPLPLPVEIASPLPLPVLDAPATAWTEISGRAVNTTTTPFAALAAHAATRYVEVSAATTNGGILYVASALLAIGASASAAYELAAGDSVRIEIDNSSKVFVAGSDGLQDYRVAIV